MKPLKTRVCANGWACVSQMLLNLGGPADRTGDVHNVMMGLGLFEWALFVLLEN